MPQSRAGNHAKQQSFTDLEREVVLGCLLGDGTLSRAGKQYRLRVEHAEQDRDYVLWKYELLRRFCMSDVQTVKQHRSCRFGTVGHPHLTQLRQEWYRPSKIVPSGMQLTPLMVAIWFMDDGTKHRDTVDFSVHSFSEECIRRLRQSLVELEVQTSVNHDGKGHRLYVLKKSYPRFERLTKPYKQACMARKWP